MQIPIENIKIKKRIRNDMGDIESLAKSMKKLGQISPIVVTGDDKLLAGGRRLEAAKLLGWHTINAVVVEPGSEEAALEIEMEENVQRQDFSADERAEAEKRLDKIRNPGVFYRIWRSILAFFKKIFKTDI